MTDIAIVNYGIGNLRSLERSFLRADVTPVVTSDPEVIAAAPRILLPGVGHFQACMESFEGSGLRPVIEAHIAADKPLLGICVGMQMMFDGSEEGGVDGLGWISGQVKRFPSEYDGVKLSVPHVGMTSVQPKKSILFEGVGDAPRFYFTHSYRAQDVGDENIAGVCQYGGAFPAAVQKGRVYGTQFHPEKSHVGGITLLKNFVERG